MVKERHFPVKDGIRQLAIATGHHRLRVPGAPSAHESGMVRVRLEHGMPRHRGMLRAA